MWEIVLASQMSSLSISLSKYIYLIHSTISPSSSSLNSSLRNEDWGTTTANEKTIFLRLIFPFR